MQRPKLWVCCALAPCNYVWQEVERYHVLMEIFFLVKGIQTYLSLMFIYICIYIYLIPTLQRQIRFQRLSLSCFHEGIFGFLSISLFRILHHVLIRYCGSYLQVLIGLRWKQHSTEFSGICKQQHDIFCFAWSSAPQPSKEWPKEWMRAICHFYLLCFHIDVLFCPQSIFVFFSFPVLTCCSFLAGIFPFIQVTSEWNPLLCHWKAIFH